jgi:hypothetical protein
MSEEGNSWRLQQLEPIPVIVNRYAPLDNLQEETKASHNHYKTNEVMPSRNTKKSLHKIKKKEPFLKTETKKKKIVVIGDSHARRYATKVSSSLGNTFEVTGTVIPGALLENITKLANSEISALGKRDVVIVIGGANDINKMKPTLDSYI